MHTVLIFGDLHFPFHSSSKLEKAIALIKRVNPTNILQLGDLYDFYSASSFPRSQNIMTPKQEIEEGRAHAEKFWARVGKQAPKAKRFQLLGNHDVRPKKRVIETIPIMESVVMSSLDSLFKFQGVETILSDKDDLEIDGVVYEHGHKGHGTHCLSNHKSTVCGHTHRPGLVIHKIRKRILWELNAGYLADPDSAVMGYGAKWWKNWTHSIAVVSDLGPQVILL